MRAMLGLVALFAGASLSLSTGVARSQSPAINNPAAIRSSAEKLADKLYPKWQLGNIPDLSKPIFLKKGSRVCKADGAQMISAIVRDDLHFLSQDKDCEVTDADFQVQIIDRCSGEHAPCNSLYRFQEKFAVAFITWEQAPRTITMDFLRMRPLLVVGVPMLWTAKSSLRN
jgi:hypothetical protein